MNIGELKPNLKDVNLNELEVLEVSPIKEFTRMGEPGRVCNALVKDLTGEVSLTLWNDQIDVVKAGIKINVTNAFVKEWQGRLQLNTGRTGTVEVLK